MTLFLRSKGCALTSTIILAGMLALAGCGGGAAKKQSRAVPPAQANAPTLHPAAAPPSPGTPTPTANPLPPDAVAGLIAQVEREYQAGEANYRAGHLAAAKQQFDNAVNLLLLSPLGVKSDPRLLDEFDRVVENVNRMEMASLKQGDGFTGQSSVPAPITEENELTFPVDPAIRAKAEAGLKGTTSDLPLVINDYVASFISYFSTQKGHAVIERALVRAGRYRSMIERTLREEGVPQDLIYLAQAESGFQPTALNPSGARGMWQLMSSRASEYGLQRNWWIDERQDPEKATRAAAKHLHDLYKQFGDWYLVMAAYDSGPGNVQYAVEKTGYADFWELYKRNVLPGETKNYVPIILAMTIMAKNPQQYGLEDVVPTLPLETEIVHVDYAVDLRLVAEASDVPLQQLVDLNPSLLRLTTPKDSAFDLHLPLGAKAKYIAAISQVPVDKRVSWRYHRVEAGDTLAAIARTYHSSPAAIAQANNIDVPEAPLRQAKLIIPITATHLAAASAIAYSRRPTHYRVRRGDTVLSIADGFGVTAERVRRWNRLKGNSLAAGKTLVIYRPAAASEAASPPTHARRRKTAASEHRSAAKTISKKSSARHKKSTAKKVR